MLTNIEGLDGSSFNDTLVGSDDANAIYGRNGNGLIYGLAGDDYLIGGQGSDTMYGGTGNDGFIFDAADFQADVQDLVMDFGVTAGNNDSLIFRFAPGTLIATEGDGGVAISTGALNYAGNIFIANTNINDVASHIVYA